MFAYIAGSSFVFEDVYGASPQLYSVLFGINACFLVAGAQLNAHLANYESIKKWTILPQDLTLEAGELTPHQKGCPTAIWMVYL